MLSLTTAPLSFSPSFVPRAPAVRMQTTEAAVGLGDVKKPEEFAYGLPGSLEPFPEFDPFNRAPPAPRVAPALRSARLSPVLRAARLSPITTCSTHRSARRQDRGGGPQVA